MGVALSLVLSLLRGVAGLFVDDGRLALTEVLILLAVGLMRLGGLGAPLAILLLVAGTVGALLANVLGAAMRTKR